VPAESDPEPNPVVPPTIDENPSATGVVDGDPEDVGSESAEADPGK
jgi:hypothetical protein